MPTFKVIVNGKILPGFEQESVENNIARLFKLTDPEKREKAFARIFSGKPMVFKKGLSQEKARAYEAAMIRAGLGCEVISEAPAGGLELETTSSPAQETPAVAPSTSIADQPDQEQTTHQEQTTSETQNPHDQPTADREPLVAEGVFVLVEPQKIAASGGIEWIKEGFNFFKQAPLAWILMTVVLMILSIVLSIIPLGSLVLNILNPVLIGGFMIACYKLTQNEEISVNDLFSGFKHRFGRLAAVGGIYLLSMTIIVVVLAGLVFAIMGQQKLVAVMNSHDPTLIVANFSIFFLIMLGIMMVVSMAYLFAPVLVVMHDVTAIEAMKMSFSGCLRNILAFFVYGIVALVLGIIAMIPLGLGYLVLMPILTASIFAAYRQIYTEADV